MLSVKENLIVDFSSSLLEKISEVKSRYPEERKKSALIPVLHLVQETYGWVSPDAMEKVASILQIELVEVFEVATFYTMFFLQPQGKYVLEVCRTGPCCLVGAERIINYIKDKLGVEEGQVTADGLFSWRGVECLASCGTGPVLQIGPEYTFYENLNEESVDLLIDSLRDRQIKEQL